MNADDLLWLELAQRGATDIGELSSDEVVDLSLRYSVWMPLDTYAESPWLAPFAIRKLRVRTDQNVAGPPRDLWGFPDGVGRFTDDNSLIKGAVRGRSVRGWRSPYGSSKLSTGLVCCHVWPRTTGDEQLFSFVPNLVWLPRSLAGFSDAHFKHQTVHDLHHVLRAVASTRYRMAPTRVDRIAVAGAWDRLPGALPSFSAIGEVNEVVDGYRVSLAAHRRTLRVVDFLTTLTSGDVPERRVSRRYHAGRGSRIDTTVPAIQEFVSARPLAQLRDWIARTL